MNDFVHFILCLPAFYRLFNLQSGEGLSLQQVTSLQLVTILHHFVDY